LAFVNLLSTAYFRELFGELSQSPPIFEVLRFDEVIEKGPTNGIYKPAEAYGDGTKILRINNFYNGYISDISALRRLSLTPNEIQLFNLAEDDIVINRVNSREFLGKSALIPKLDEPIVFESNMMRISLKKNLIDPVFCIHVLQTKHIGNQILMSAKDAVNQSSINQKDVRGFQFPLPPLPLQRAFAARVAEIDKLKAHHRAHLARLDALFASLQHRAFRGDLSVPKSETSPCDSFSHGEKVAPP
jgi:type I restriction enzyme S subunit